MIIESCRQNQTNTSTRYPTQDSPRDSPRCQIQISSSQTLDIDSPTRLTHSSNHTQSPIPKKRYVRSLAFRVADLDDPFLDLYFATLTTKQHTNRVYVKALPIAVAGRTELINFCWSVCKQLGYSLSTYYLSLAYLDAVLAQFSIKQFQGRICAYSAVTLAAKLEECVDKIPTMSETLSFFQNVFDDETFEHYERVIFQCLGFQLNMKTPYTLLNAYLTMGVVTEEELLDRILPEQTEDFCISFENLAAFFLEVGTLEYQFNKFSSQKVAASAILCARWCIGLSDLDSVALESLRLKWEDVEGCLLMLAEAASQKSDSKLSLKVKEKLIELAEEILNVRVQSEEMVRGMMEDMSLGEQEGITGLSQALTCNSPQNTVRGSRRDVCQSSERNAGEEGRKGVDGKATKPSTVRKERLPKKSAFTDSFGTIRVGRSSAYRMSK